MIHEERIRYLTLRADGDVGNQVDIPHGALAHKGWEGLGPDEVLLRIVGRRISPSGPFKPVSVEIIA